MAAIETSSFPKSEYNGPKRKPRYSNISSSSSDLQARSSPEFQGEVPMKEENVDNEGEAISTLKTQIQKPVPKFPNRSQDELMKMFGPRPNRKPFYFEESDESEEEGGISLEELKQTEGYKLFIKNLDEKFGKPVSCENM